MKQFIEIEYLVSKKTPSTNNIETVIASDIVEVDNILRIYEIPDENKFNHIRWKVEVVMSGVLFREDQKANIELTKGISYYTLNLELYNNLKNKLIK